MQFQAPVPHFDLGYLQCPAPEQRRIGVELLEIAADRDRFRDRDAVVEYQHRHALDRIDRGEGGRLLRHRAEIDLLQRHL